MGSAELKAFFAKRRELSVSTYQMCILLLFNNQAKLSYKEIKEATDIPENDLKRNLLSLTATRHKILLHEQASSSSSSSSSSASPADGAAPSSSTPSKRVEEADEFSFNSAFKSKLYKVRVMNVSQRESEPERVETRQKVDEDRKHQIEAAIVRIMKARKTMDHSNLISEVTRQLTSRFLPNPIVIKKRIESLIEREYLERSKTDRKLYNYLA